MVETVCDLVDQELACGEDLAMRYPRSPPAQGKPSRTLIQYVRDRPGHDRRYAVDSSKIGGLGFATRTPLAAGLAATVRWYLENESWWRAIVNGEYRHWYANQYSGTKCPAAARCEGSEPAAAGGLTPD